MTPLAWPQPDRSTTSEMSPATQRRRIGAGAIVALEVLDDGEVMNARPIGQEIARLV
jgi:hypothetical protein